MNKTNFTQMIMLAESPSYRAGAIFQSIADAGDWETWSQAKGKNGVQPYFPNDIIFACLYSQFKKNPTNIRAAQLAFMISPRSKSEWGFMIDPAHEDSDARKYIRTRLPTYTLLMKENTKGAIANDFAPVFTEMFSDNGSLKQWCAATALTAQQLDNNRKNNRTTISQSQAKKDYYITLKKKYCGIGLQADNMKRTGNPNWVAYVEVFRASNVGMDDL